jgi:hypothetical protein
MPTIADFPTLDQEALTVFGDVFDTAPARRHFAEYLTGLMMFSRRNLLRPTRSTDLCTPLT